MAVWECAREVLGEHEQECDPGEGALEAKRENARLTHGRVAALSAGGREAQPVQIFEALPRGINILPQLRVSENTSKVVVE